MTRHSNVLRYSRKLCKLTDYMFTVQCGADMTKHQFGGHCNPPFPGKCRASFFTSTLTSRTAAGDNYYKLMGPYFIARRNVPSYLKSFPCVNLL